MEEFSYTLKVPRDRVAVLIGSKGEVKRQLEAATKTKILVDSNEGDVTLSGADALNLYAAREIVRAIGRGFNPDIAQLLLKQDYGFEVINILDYAKTKNDVLRLKGRVIGEGGKSWKVIEELTNTNLSVYGKSVSILGELEFLPTARRAVDMLLSGCPHATVYRWLEKRSKDVRHRQRMGDADGI